MAYITYTEYTDWYSTDKSQTLVETAIDWASSMVDKLAGTRFVTSTCTETFYGDGYKKRFLLHNRPLISVVSVTETDEFGSTTSKTVDHTLADISCVILDAAVGYNRRIDVVYTYGNLTDSELAKLATIHLTRAALKMFDNNGGIFPSLSVTKGDLSYQFDGNMDDDTKALLMSVQNIINNIKKQSFYIIENREGKYESLR